MDEKFRVNLHDFQIQCPLGNGATSEVYKVKEKRTGKCYAAKRLTNISNSSEDILMITREVNTLCKIEHPYIIKLRGYSSTDFNDLPYPVIILELASNRTFRNILDDDKNGLSNENWDDTKKLICIYGIAHTMLFLHSKSILHRDLKPGNMLIDANLFPKIADFGFSKQIGNNSENSTNFTLGPKGAPIYMAPEIWETNDYTESSDVYAFAMIVYEIMTLETPFENFAIYQISDAVIRGKRPEIKGYVP